MCILMAMEGKAKVKVHAYTDKNVVYGRVTDTETVNEIFCICFSVIVEFS